MATMENRRFVYAFNTPQNTVSIVNYDAGHYILNNFLSMFDLNENPCLNKGERKVSDNGNYLEVWFECSKDMWDILHTETFRRALKRMGVELVFTYPYK